MAEQLTMEGMQHLRAQINSTLMQLCPPDRIDTPTLQEFLPEYPTADVVPADKLEYVAKVMQAEIIMRRRLGDDIYFALRTISDKQAAYFDTLICAEIDEDNEGPGRQMSTSIAWMHYDTKIFKQAIITAAAKMANNRKAAIQSGTTAEME